MAKAIHLDGTTLEGGGQLLRVAVGLSALTQQPIKITDIRGNRSGGGGLKLQHLTGVQWLSQACEAPTRGAEKKSKTVNFWAKDHDPASLKTVKRGQWGLMEKTIEIGSPGAIGLVFQAILPFVLFTDNEGTEQVIHITIKGGTNVSHSPSVDYLQRVLVPMLEKIGVGRVEVKCRSRGWSTGRTEIGAVSFSITPFQRGEGLPSFTLKEKGHVTRIEAIALGPRASEKLFHREIKKSLEAANLQDIPLNVDFELSGHEKRLYLLLIAHTSTGMRLGRDHLLQERFSTLDLVVPKVVQNAAEDLTMELNHGGCVDEFMQDQLIVFQALAKGKSEVTGNEKLSLHAQTAQWVAEEILGVQFASTGVCDGVGWEVGKLWKRRKPDVDDLSNQIQDISIASVGPGLTAPE